MANKNRHKIVAVFVAFLGFFFLNFCLFLLVSPYFLLFHDILEPKNSPPNEVTGANIYAKHGREFFWGIFPARPNLGARACDWDEDPYRNCHIQTHFIVLKNKAIKVISSTVFPATAMLKVIGLSFVFLLDAVPPSFFHETSIQNMAYFGPKLWGVGIFLVTCPYPKDPVILKILRS